MHLNATWRPDEDNFTIINERTWLAGMVLTAVAYGVVLVLFFPSNMQFIQNTTRTNYKQKLPFLISIWLMFILGSILIGASAKITELGFVDARLFPGGMGNWFSVYDENN